MRHVKYYCICDVASATTVAVFVSHKAQRKVHGVPKLRYSSSLCQSVLGLIEKDLDKNIEYLKSIKP